MLHSVTTCFHKLPLKWESSLSYANSIQQCRDIHLYHVVLLPIYKLKYYKNTLDTIGFTQGTQTLTITNRQMKVKLLFSFKVNAYCLPICRHCTRKNNTKTPTRNKWALWDRTRDHFVLLSFVSCMHLHVPALSSDTYISPIVM